MRQKWFFLSYKKIYFRKLALYIVFYLCLPFTCTQVHVGVLWSLWTAKWKPLCSVERIENLSPWLLFLMMNQWHNVRCDPQHTLRVSKKVKSGQPCWKRQLIMLVLSAIYRASQAVLVVKNPPANAGDEPAAFTEWSKKERDQYCILTHISGI